MNVGDGDGGPDETARGLWSVQSVKEDDVKKLMKNIGAAIKRLRKARGLTQSDLGKLIGKPQSTIARIEASINNDTHIGVLLEIARALDVRLADVIAEIEGNPGTGGTEKQDWPTEWDEVRAQVDALPLAQREWIAKIVREIVVGL